MVDIRLAQIAEFILRKNNNIVSKDAYCFAVLSRFSVKVDGVKCFTFEEMAAATGNLIFQLKLVREVMEKFIKEI